ncbi:MAG: cupin domain-containing protein [Anaerolineales bacterium]|nr:cupin domain-containing protein [Anaerolineales bacterium]
MTHEDFGKEAQSLAGLIDYQSGSVVSRTMINKTAGTVTLFAFDENQGLSEHTTPYDALVLIVDGALEVTIDGVSHRLSHGEVLLMPADKPHAVHASERSKMLLVMIRE